MYLTINKKFEFSSSHRLFLKNKSDDDNLRLFGKAASGQYGHGHNYNAYFVFNGPVDDLTGMMINVVEIKKIISEFLYERYDHKYLNQDTPPFDNIIPTVENIAVELLNEAQPYFKNSKAKPIACHLIESPSREATAFSDGRVESQYMLDFSAARITRSPHLSDEENKSLFKTAASLSGHGHHYRLRVTLDGEFDRSQGMFVPTPEVSKSLQDVYETFDHKNISLDIEDFKKLPSTTEMMTSYIFNMLSDHLPVNRVRLHENDSFFVEFDRTGNYKMTTADNFYAAHRLHSEKLSDEENLKIYDKCNNPGGHGHNYRIETTIDTPLDERSGTMFDLEKFRTIVRDVINPWDFRHLNLDTDDFKGKVTTGENIVAVLWEKLEDRFNSNLHRLRLWETDNNRFCLRKRID